MGGSATREPELIYVVRGGGAMNLWSGVENHHPARPNVSFSARFLATRFTCWLRYTDQKLRAIMNMGPQTSRMGFLARKILHADWLLFPIPFHRPLGMGLLARKWVPLARLYSVWQSS